jgi:arylsulfatase A-like enzyme
MKRGVTAAAVVAVVVAALVGACGNRGTSSARDELVGAGQSPGAVQAGGWASKADSRPNIVFVLMDDFSMDLLATMRSARYLARHGASYDNAFVVDSLCCVSRSATFTGQYPHQTGVLSNAPRLGKGLGPLGGWQAFDENGGEDRTFAVGLQQAGYTTGFVGKYLNGYPLGAEEGVPPIPPGWSDFRAISSEAYDGWDFTSTQPRADGSYETRHWPAPPRTAPERVRDRAYAGTVIEHLALDFIRGHRDDAAPFFLEIAPYAPHSAIGEPPPYDDEPLFPPAFRDRPGPGSPYGNCGLVRCGELTAEDLPGFGEMPDNRSYVEYDSRAPKVDFQGHELTEERAETDLRNRARMAQSIDRMVMRILRAVDAESPGGTYVVLTSDNGYHLGQHGLMRGKGTAYDTDTHVPALVVGPGVTRGHRSPMTSNLDWAPTFEDLAGITSPAYRSGASLVPTFADPDAPLHDYVFFEHTHLRSGPGVDPDRPYTGGGLNAIPSYVAVHSRIAMLVRNDLDRRWGHAEYAYEFYDYRTQETERVNQLDDPAYASEVATLMAKLDEWDGCRHLRGTDPVSSECRSLTQEAPLG